MTTPVAALYVQPRGVYYGLDGVDPWGLPERDARDYAGPYPVVAHPPCSRWCRLAGLVEARWGHKRGDDGGTFEAALRAVRTWGGVLEHPAYTHAWAAYGLTRPLRGGWHRTLDGGWVAHVEQGHYGHRARKATWLYAFAVTRLPMLETADSYASDGGAYVSDGGRDKRRRRSRAMALTGWCGNHVASDEDRPRLTKREASRTPEAFRDLLLDIARSARGGGAT